jgi:hypothetical protein
MNLRAKKFQKPCCLTRILSLAGQEDQIGGRTAGLVCDAVSIHGVRGLGGKPGICHQMAGANLYVFAYGQYGRKLVPQLLIASDQLFGALPHLRHLLDKRG